MCVKVTVPDQLNLLIPDEVKEFGSSLEVAGRKERAGSLSSINILISPCGSSLRPPQNGCGAAPTQTDAGLDKAEKTRLEAAASFPLARTSSPTHSTLAPHRKSIGGVPSSPASTFSPFVASSVPHCRVQPPAEEKHDVGTPASRADSRCDRHGNRGEEQFLVGEDQMYPTLRSKSLNENPRKTKRREREETLHSSASVKDLASAFSGIAEVLRSTTETRVSDGGTP